MNTRDTMMVGGGDVTLWRLVLEGGAVGHEISSGTDATRNTACMCINETISVVFTRAPVVCLQLHRSAQAHFSQTDFSKRPHNSQARRRGGRRAPENLVFLDSRVMKTHSQKLKSQPCDPTSHRGAGEGPFWPPWRASSREPVSPDARR